MNLNFWIINYTMSFFPKLIFVLLLFLSICTKDDSNPSFDVAIYKLSNEKSEFILMNLKLY